VAGSKDQAVRQRAADGRAPRFLRAGGQIELQRPACDWVVATRAQSLYRERDRVELEDVMRRTPAPLQGYYMQVRDYYYYMQVRDYYYYM
jgi:hypothetical protein